MMDDDIALNNFDNMQYNLYQLYLWTCWCNELRLITCELSIELVYLDK